MQKDKKNYISSLFSLLLVLLIFTGCGTPKDVSYFQDVNEDLILMPSTGEIKIKPGDQITILVKTMDRDLSSLFNLEVVASRVGEGTGLASSGISKYNVSPQGEIDFPVLGDIKVAGMTRSELAGFIKGELMGRNLAKDPVVSVEFSNLGVSVLGEVNKPGSININNDKITIIEAISQAGDLKIEGKRDNVLVVRDNNGETQTYRVDLTNFKELAQSPVYYLNQGDVVYVEPNDMRKRLSTTNGNNVYSTSFWISVASLLTSITTTVGVFVLR
ncbi:MAG: polysaccharide export protein [Muribaculaceae bacterium]|nr:polysaccharide export protein [Muribaculaceae bacterium]